jgi:hypothetical protein
MQFRSKGFIWPSHILTLIFKLFHIHAKSMAGSHGRLARIASNSRAAHFVSSQQIQFGLQRVCRTAAIGILTLGC